MGEYVRQVNTNIELSQEIERLNNIIKEVGKILNNKRDKMIMQQFDCDFEELLYQIDEEIREVIKNCTKNNQNGAIENNDEAIEGEIK